MLDGKTSHNDRTSAAGNCTRVSHIHLQMQCRHLNLKTLQRSLANEAPHENRQWHSLIPAVTSFKFSVFLEFGGFILHKEMFYFLMPVIIHLIQLYIFKGNVLMLFFVMQTMEDFIEFVTSFSV